MNCVAGGSPVRKVLTNDSDERRSGNVQLVAREEPTLRTGNQRKQYIEEKHKNVNITFCSGRIKKIGKIPEFFS